MGQDILTKRPHGAASALLARTVSPGWLTATIAAWLGGSQLLLWRFLDIAPLWAYALGLAGLTALCVFIVRVTRDQAGSGPTVGTLAICLIAALALFALGGEGRFFYANIDWQVRDAVQRDMAINPWPFVYTARAIPDVLRAPIGMFLVPALAFKALGPRAADLALLIQNTCLLSIVLALASQLFETPKARIIALAIFVAFSGLDILGRYVIRHSLVDHLESWSLLQYSSAITLAFWVPQHALAGWIGAVAFLLWRAGRMPPAVFFAILPLTALWSPLALMGIVPFALLAGIISLCTRRLTLADILLPLLVLLLCVPSLLYLGAANDAVGARFYPIAWPRFVLFQMLETLPYLVPLAIIAWRRKLAHFDRLTLILVTLCLLAMPLLQIGWSIDFMMRASIPALAILSVMVADAIVTQDRAVPSFARYWLIAMLAIGSVTGLSEIRRAVSHPPSPRVACTFFKAWDQNFAFYPKGSYLAPLPSMPALVRPVEPSRASAIEPARCWQGHWYVPSGI